MLHRIAGTAAALALTFIAGTLIPGTAHADPAGAATCAAKLSKPARMIYDASAPQAAGTGDLKGLVTGQTKGLVMAGKIDRSGARPAAVSAGQCLVMLKS
jgi:hypothetical protein